MNLTEEICAFQKEKTYSEASRRKLRFLREKTYFENTLWIAGLKSEKWRGSDAKLPTKGYGEVWTLGSRLEGVDQMWGWHG